IDAEGLRRSAASPAGQAVARRYPRDDGGKRWVNWLFVGRVAPHKRHNELIAAFSHYQRHLQQRSRLLLVGAWQAFPAYKAELDYQIARLGARDVTFAGQPALAEGFGGWYAAADIFVSASEHEGFGLPLVEAMAFGLPVVARARAGVPGAVGDCGLLVDRSEPEALAEGARILLDDSAVRAFYAAGQPARVAAHDRAHVAAALREALAVITGGR
ncbi:MAG: glycosyltransferase, partial [Thermoflexales bacterium]